MNSARRQVVTSCRRDNETNIIDRKYIRRQVAPSGGRETENKITWPAVERCFISSFFMMSHRLKRETERVIAIVGD